MNKIHNFIGEQIIKYIFRRGGMITVQRKAGAVQVAKVYSKAAYENVIVPAFNLYTHQNIKTNADRIRVMSDEELTEFITGLCEHCLAGIGACDCSGVKTQPCYEFSGDMTQKMLKEEYLKSVDDFTEKIIRYVDCGHLCSPTEIRWSDLAVVEMVKKIAEQLKKEVGE